MSDNKETLSYLHQAMLSLRNNPAEVLVKAAQQGDRQSVEFIMDHDPSTTRNKEHLIVRHIQIPEAYLAAAVMESFMNGHFKLSRDILKTSRQRLSRSTYQNMIYEIVKSTTMGAVIYPDAQKVLKVISNQYPNLSRDPAQFKAFSTALKLLATHENPTDIARNFDRYVSWNIQKEQCINAPEQIKTEKRRANIAHLESRRDDIANKAKTTPHIRRIK